MYRFFSCYGRTPFIVDRPFEREQSPLSPTPVGNLHTQVLRLVRIVANVERMPPYL